MNENQLKLGTHLALASCPFCNVASPQLAKQWGTRTTDHKGEDARDWAVYACGSCGGIVTAWARPGDLTVGEVCPTGVRTDPAVPDPARSYLDQAMNSLHAPAGAVLLASSAAEALLRARGYREGSIRERLAQAAQDHLIPGEMMTWGERLRLGTQPEDSASLPNADEAGRAVEFVNTLAIYLFVLPARIKHGLEAKRTRGR